MAVVTLTGPFDTPVFAEPTSISIAVNVEIQQKGAINWDKGVESDVTAIGIGLLPDNMGTRGNILAHRTAIVDGIRNFDYDYAIP